MNGYREQRSQIFHSGNTCREDANRNVVYRTSQTREQAIHPAVGSRQHLRANRRESLAVNDDLRIPWIIRCSFILLFGLAVAKGAPSFPTSFAIYGHGGSENFSPARAVKTSESTRIFSAWFSNNLWQIRLENLSPGIDYAEIGTDGTNIFSVLSTETRYRREISEGRKLQNNSEGEITRGPVPHERAYSHVGLLWFAFASHRL